ncbi:uncharacterized protein LOC134725132 [Mytilus trossulus]|uniref:uncharacterized protein LOC134725132 n=1 Tax=Mytilus trossulus TaxID=6551 RepID=UPI003004DD42
MNTDINNKTGPDVDTHIKVETKLAPQDEAVKAQSGHGEDRAATGSTHTFKTEYGKMEVLFEYSDGTLVGNKDAHQHESSTEKDSLQESNSTATPVVAKYEQGQLIQSVAKPIQRVASSGTCEQGQLIQSIPKPIQRVASSGTCEQGQLIHSVPKPIQRVASSCIEVIPVPSVNFNKRPQETILSKLIDVPLVQILSSSMNCDPSTKPHNIVEKVSHFPENEKHISTPGFTGVSLSGQRTTLVPYAKFPNTLPFSMPSSTATTKQLLLAKINARKSTARSTLDPPTTQHNAASVSKDVTLSKILPSFVSPSATSQNVSSSASSQNVSPTATSQNVSSATIPQNLFNKLVQGNITQDLSSKLLPLKGKPTGTKYIIVKRKKTHSTTESSNVIENQDTGCKLTLEPQSAGHVVDQPSKRIKESFITLSQNVSPATTSQNVSSSASSQNVSPATLSQNLSNKLVQGNITQNLSSKVLPLTGKPTGTKYITVKRTKPHSTTESSNVIENQDTGCKLPLKPQSAGHVVVQPSKRFKKIFVTLESSRKKDAPLTADQYVNEDQPIKIKNVNATECGQFETVITPACIPETEVCRHSSLCSQTVFTECGKTTLNIEDPMDIECDKSNNKHDKAMVESEVCLPGSKNVNMFNIKRVEHCVPLQNILSRKKNALPASITRQGQLSVQTQPQSQILVQIQPEGQPFVQTPPEGQLSVQTQPQHCLSLQNQPEGQLSVQAQSVSQQSEQTGSRSQGQPSVRKRSKGKPSMQTQPQSQLLVPNPLQAKVSVKINGRVKLFDQQQIQAKLLKEPEFRTHLLRQPVFQFVQTEPQGQPLVMNKEQKSQVKKTKKQECRPKEVGRLSSEAKGRDQMEVTLDRPWDLGTENDDIDQDVAESSNLQTETQTAQISNNLKNKKVTIIYKKKSLNTDMQTTDQKRSRKRKCLEIVEKPKTETNSSLPKINKTGADVHIGKRVIVEPVTSNKEDISANDVFKKKKMDAMTAGEKRYQGKFDDPDTNIKGSVSNPNNYRGAAVPSCLSLIRSQMVPMLTTGKILCKFCGEEFWLARNLQKHLTFSHLEKGGQMYIRKEENLVHHFERRIEEMNTLTKEMALEHQDKKKIIPKMHTCVENETNSLDNNVMKDIDVILTKINCSNDQLLNTVYTTDIWYCRTCNQSFTGNNLTTQLQKHPCSHQFSVLYIYPQVSISLPSTSDDKPSTPYLDLDSFLLENGLVYVESTSSSGTKTQNNSQIETQNNSQIETQNNSRIETQSNSQVETQSNSLIETQINSGIETQSNITRKPPIVTKELIGASKNVIKKMDVVDSSVNLVNNSNKESCVSDISDDITAVVEKFREAFNLKFEQDIIKMRCPKCLVEVYLDDFDEHTNCENIQLKNQVLRFCSVCKIGFLSESLLNAHIFFEHKDKSQDVNFGQDIQSDVPMNTRSLGHKELNTLSKQSVTHVDTKFQLDDMLKTILKSNTNYTFDEIFCIFEQGHVQNMLNQKEDQKKDANVKNEGKVDEGKVNSESISMGCKICKTFTSCEKLSSHFYLVHCTNNKCCRFCEEMYVGNVHVCCNEKEPKYITRINKMKAIRRQTKKTHLIKIQGTSSKEKKVRQLLGQLFCQCKICKVGFLSLPKLNVHILNEHTDKHVCILCKTIFASENCAENHLCTEITEQLKKKNNVTGLYEICYDRQKDEVQNPKDMQNQSTTNYLKCPECEEDLGVDDFNENTKLQNQVIYTCRNCKLNFKSIFCTICKCPFDSLEMLYSHFYSQHQTDTKCCLFCRLAYIGDNHYCGKREKNAENAENIPKRGSNYKMHFKKRFKKQKCLKCEYIINFCTENTDVLSCNQLGCIACHKVGECHGDTCHICGQVFHSFAHRSYHEYTEHQEGVIELWTNRKKEFRRDYLNDYNIKRYKKKRKDRHKCAICEKRFTYFVKKKQHEFEVHGIQGTKYHCDVCDMKDGSYERMKKHMEEHYKGEGTPNTDEIFAKKGEKKEVVCYICGKSLLKRNLNAHLRKYHEAANSGSTSTTMTGKIVCYKCGQIVKKKNFNAHFRERHMEKEEMCEICGKMFYHRGKLNEHRKLKHSENKEKKVKKKGPPQQCNICGKILANKKSLYIHEKLKHSHKKFQCQICGKKYFYSFLLKDHMKQIHEKFNPIVCQYCNYRCYMKSSLVKHMQHNH